METVLILLAIFFGPAILKVIFGALLGLTDGSGQHMAAGGATLSGMDVRVELSGNSTQELTLYEVQAKARGGVLAGGSESICFYTSLVDVTDDESAPVMGLMEVQQEPSTYAFQFVGPEVPVSHDFTMTGFVGVAGIAPQVLHFPDTGSRSVKVIVRMLAGDASRDSFRAGMYVGSPSDLLCEGSAIITLEETGIGYKEAHRHEVEALEVGATVGIGVAAADGAITADEMATVSDWLRGQFARLGSAGESVRTRCNEAMASAHEVVLHGGDPLAGVAKRLGELPESHQARVLDIGYQVLAADGQADPGELAVLEALSRGAGIDQSVVSRIHDLALLGVESISRGEEGDLPSLLGFDPEASSDSIRRHLRGLMQKWNARSANAKTNEERDRVQLMLQRIAEATSRYTS